MPEKLVFKIRPMAAGDLEQALSLSISEGWNQTENDWRLLFENPVNVCLVAEYNDKVAGTATAICYSDKVAWIGMVLVDKSLRGQGAGKMLLTSIIEKLKHIESIKLDATPAGQPLYQSLGFTEELKVFRMTNISLNSSELEVTSNKLTRIDQGSLLEVLKLDNNIFGADRSYLLQTILLNYPEKGFLLNQNHRIEGFIFGREGVRFNYIGPVSAFSTEAAQILIKNALQTLNEKPVAIDVLKDKEDLIEWLESLGFVKQRYFVRMYLKSNDFKGILKNQYLISGPEFG